MILETHHVFINTDRYFPSSMWPQLVPFISLVSDTIFMEQQSQVENLDCEHNAVIICTCKTRGVKNKLH